MTRPCMGMHSRMAPLQALCLILLLIAASLVDSASAPYGIRLELTHVDSKGSFPKSQLLRRAAHRSRLRVAMLSATHGAGGAGATTWDTRPKMHWSSNEYVVELAIGTPPVPFIGIADTGSDLIWTQSLPCTRCAYQPTPVYNPFASRSFSLEPCSSAMCRGTDRYSLDHSCSNNTRPQRCQYTYGYGDGAYSKGVLGRETLTFPAGGSRPGASPFVSVAGVAFGCGNDNMGDMFNSTGMVGLGRGPLSLVAQLGFGKFSYCLTNYFETKLTSPLLFGSLADLTSTAGGHRAGAAAAVQSTPLLHVAQGASLYYVSLEGVSIGNTRLPIPEDVFELRSDGTGGVIFDSGTTFTSLDARAFKVVRAYVEEMLDLPPSNDTSLSISCYSLEAGAELPDMPDVVLHFADGADMRLHRDAVLYREEESAMCVGIEGSRGLSIIGNFQQQNLHVLYDITEGLLSFAPADCSKL